jgi:hypothetical protein
MWDAVLLGCSILLLLIVSFLAFYRVRMQRDEAERKNVNGISAPANKESTNPQVEFYENRTTLNGIRKGLEEELKTVEDAWLLTFTGVYAANLELFKLHRIKKLILLHPEGREIITTAPAFNREPDETAGLIRTTTRNAQQAGGVEVRWFDGPITGMLIGDPDSLDPNKGWVRVEVPFPYWGERVGFLITKAEYPNLFKALRATFLEQERISIKAPSLSNSRCSP